MGRWMPERANLGRVNEAQLGKKARFGYVGLCGTPAGQSPQIGAFEAFARYDLKDGTKELHQFPAGQTVCEPVFVADAHGKHEEDGFVFSSCMITQKRKVFL
jgi:carotenoid cleavage dioxygenase-like enzyme